MVLTRTQLRSKKQEARSKKQEEDSPVRLVFFFWLLTIDSGPFWLLASDLRQSSVF